MSELGDHEEGLLPATDVVLYVLAFWVGIVAGMRAMTAPAAVSWAARLGRLDLEGTWLAFIGYAWAPWILTVLAAGELVTDQLPTTPSRKVPVQFATRIVMGGVCGAAIGSGAGSMLLGALAGIAGAVVGTLGGSVFRARLAAAFGNDRPAALVEDAVAIVSAILIVLALR
jgi:uncharacterized membrane protein